MPALIYDFTIGNVYFKIFMSGSDTVLSEKEMEVLFDLTSEELWLLVRCHRLTFVYLEEGRMFFLLKDVTKWLSTAAREMGLAA